MSALIWASCLDRPRTVGSLISEWGYSSPTSFYRGNFIKELLKEKLIEKKQERIEKTGKREILYYSIFEGYDKIAKERIKGKAKLILNDMDVWKKVLNDDYIRSTFFELEAIKELFNKNPRLGQIYGFTIPVIIAVGLVSTTSNLLKHGLATTKEEYKRSLPYIFEIYGGMVGDINVEGYLKAVIPKLDLRIMKKFSFVNNTEYVKRTTEKFDKLLEGAGKLKKFLLNLSGEDKEIVAEILEKL